MSQVRKGVLRGCSAASVAVLALALGACGDGGTGGTPDMGVGTDSSTAMPDATIPTGDTGMTTDPDVVTSRETGTPDTGMTATCGGGMGPCNPVTAQGCMTGQACVQVDSMGTQTTMCVAAGTGGPGTACTSPSECREGFACVGPSAGMATCQRLCCGAGDDERCRSGPSGQPGARCSGRINGSDLYLCSVPTRCDVFMQNCPSGGACVVTETDGTTDCIPAGTPAAGQPCGGTGGMQCSAGNVCLITMMGATMGTCFHFCDPSVTTAGAARGCAAGMTCVRAPALFPSTIGVCQANMM